MKGLLNSSSSIFFLSLCALIFASPAVQADTAKQAVQALQREKGANAVRNIVAMRGLRGQDQPAKWDIVTSQPSLREYRRYLVGGGKILAEKTERTAPSNIVLRLDKMRLDSSDAFKVANQEASKRYLGFDNIDYELRAVDYSYSPVWRIVLNSRDGKPVAKMEISAESGKVRWPSAGNAPQGSQQGYATPTSESLPVSEREIDYSRYDEQDYWNERDLEKSWERNYRWWHKSTDGLEYAGHNIKEGFRDTGAAFRDIFNGTAVYRSTGKKRVHVRKAAHTRPHPSVIQKKR